MGLGWIGIEGKVVEMRGGLGGEGRDRGVGGLEEAGAGGMGWGVGPGRLRNRLLDEYSEHADAQ